MMEFIWIRNIEMFVKIRQEWDEVLISSNFENPFMLSDYIITWWNEFGGKHRLLIYLLIENNNIIGGFPLYCRIVNQKGFKIRVIQPVGDSFSNITDPFYICATDKFRSMFLKGLNDINNWDLLDLQRVKMDFLNILKNKDAKINKYYYNIRQTDSNAYIDNLHSFLSGDTYLQSRGYKLRRNTRNFTRKANKIGIITLYRIERLVDYSFYLNKYVEYSISSRIKRTDKSYFEDNKKQLFIKKVIIALAKKGYIELLALKYGINLVGIVIGLRFGKGFNWVFTSFNPEYNNLSPGYVLISKLIDYSIKRGYPYIDLYAGGGVFYKQQWCNHFQELYKIKLFNNTIKGNTISKVYNYIKND